MNFLPLEGTPLSLTFHSFMDCPKHDHSVNVDSISACIAGACYFVPISYLFLNMRVAELIVLRDLLRQVDALQILGQEGKLIFAHTITKILSV